MASNKENGCAKIIGLGAGFATILGTCIALGAWLFPFDSIPSIIDNMDYQTSPYSTNLPPTACLWSFDNVRVASLKLFENDGNYVDIEDRIYDKYFSSKTAKYINWELSLANNCPASKKEDFVIEVTYFNPDGTIDGQYSTNAYFDEGWTSMYHTNGWGSDELGTWDVGRYKLSLRIIGLAEIVDFFDIKP